MNKGRISQAGRPELAVRAAVVAVALVAAAYAYGALAGRAELMPHVFLKRALFPLTSIFTTPRAYSDLSTKHEIPCRDAMKGRIMVALIIGQSNAANYGSARHVSGPGVFNFFKGRCYEASDPLLGASGEGGSIWTRLGDMIVEAGKFDSVLLVPVGIGGSGIKRWTPGRDLYPLIQKSAAGLRQQGIQITHVLFQQGENDILTPVSEYQRHFRAMLKGLREQGITAPVFVALSTKTAEGVSDDLRLAQKGLFADGADGVRAGPDTDIISGIEYRPDGVHFSGAGLDECAKLWYAAIIKTDRDLKNME